MWCFTYSGGYCAPMIPEAENSSSRRFVITVAFGKRSSWPRVVDVVVRVQDPADVVALQAVQLELRVEPLPLLDVSPSSRAAP